MICSLFPSILSGKTGIRTLGTVARSPHFECGPIDHSGIFPSVSSFAGAKIKKKSKKGHSPYRKMPFPSYKFATYFLK